MTEKSDRPFSLYRLKRGETPVTTAIPACMWLMAAAVALTLIDYDFLRHGHF